MIRFPWKGVEVVARKTKSGWIALPDCRLDRFETEQQAAERLGGSIVSDEQQKGA